jgi:hypothetical protein
MPDDPVVLVVMVVAPFWFHVPPARSTPEGEEGPM